MEKSEKQVTRQRLYLQEVQIKDVKAVHQYGRTNVIIYDVDGKEYKHELYKEVEETNKLSGDFVVESKKREKVKPEEIMNHLPDVFIRLNQALKTTKPLKCMMSFSKATYVVGDKKTEYYTLYTSDVNTLYCDVIEDNDDKLLKQTERKLESEERAKGKELNLE